MNLQDVIRFVGVTGLPAAGKGEFINVLQPLLSEQGFEMRYYSLSDELRAEARRRDLTVDRRTLRRIANNLRLEHGSGVLSAMVVKKMQQELALLPVQANLVVIVDAIRNPEEVMVLRQALGDRFLLVSVDAPLEVLIDRIASRARYDEPDEFVQQREAARKMILGELGEDEPAHGHNIAECVAMADYHIDNSDSLQALVLETQRFIESVILVKARNK